MNARKIYRASGRRGGGGLGPGRRRVKRPRSGGGGSKSTGCLMAIPAVAAGVVAGFGVVLAVLGLVNGGWTT